MELQEAIDSRRSIRRYDGEKKVSQEDLGLDTLVMGNRDAEALKELLDIDDSQEIGPVILVGYPAEEPWEKKRKPTEEVVRYF